MELEDTKYSLLVFLLTAIMPVHASVIDVSPLADGDKDAFRKVFSKEIYQTVWETKL